MVKFRGVLDPYQSSELNQIEAAELLSVTGRTFRQWCVRFKESGDSGLLDRRLREVSGKRISADRSAEVEALYCARSTSEALIDNVPAIPWPYSILTGKRGHL